MYERNVVKRYFNSLLRCTQRQIYGECRIKRTRVEYVSLFVCRLDNFKSHFVSRAVNNPFKFKCNFLTFETFAEFTRLRVIHHCCIVFHYIYVHQGWRESAVRKVHFPNKLKLDLESVFVICITTAVERLMRFLTLSLSLALFPILTPPPPDYQNHFRL